MTSGIDSDPLLVCSVKDRLTDEVRLESLCTMTFTDYIAICSENREQIEESLKRWRYVPETRGMQVKARHKQSLFVCMIGRLM